jgi:hypothetical protein
MRTFESVVGSRGGAYMFDRQEVVDALKQRGFGEVRQRIAGFTQFVGGTLASAAP